ncbi:hypothetical protein HHK36_013191 [Tetracentron sinense]|uniref:EXS domain-containing protein n=1 Tax=Tetracentron sinense TaxID=13715 RepID=A0A834Z7A8_TETSI|nr:hypothetical protein HHK36_013191 [Tetracentron sinense]
MGFCHENECGLAGSISIRGILYYNPLLLVTMMVWFWGVNLWVFTQANVYYTKIFDLDQNHLTHRNMEGMTFITSG